MSSIHAQAFNLARRNSIKNENDLLQENFLEEDDSSATMIVNERYCSSLLKQHLPASFEFPPECFRFDSVRSGIVRRNSKRDDDAVAFVGMDPVSAIKAMSARDHGHPHSAQITRRLTSKSKDSESSWF